MRLTKRNYVLNGCQEAVEADSVTFDRREGNYLTLRRRRRHGTARAVRTQPLLLLSVTADSRVRGASDDVSDCPAPRAGKCSWESIPRYFTFRVCCVLRWAARPQRAVVGGGRKAGPAGGGVDKRTSAVEQNKQFELKAAQHVFIYISLKGKPKVVDRGDEPPGLPPVRKGCLSVLATAVDALHFFSGAKYI